MNNNVLASWILSQTKGCMLTDHAIQPDYFVIRFAKVGVWNRIKARVFTFITDGKEFKVFIKSEEKDFSKGSSDRHVVKEIKSHGGEVKFVPKLLAKLYVIDRGEALISSANLTRSGRDFRHEAGIWMCNPIIVNEACRFIEKLSRLSASG
jgi:hypothetical protein